MTFPVSKSRADATIIAILRDDERKVHSYLLDMGQGVTARLPIDELRTLPKGAKERVLKKGSQLRVRVIHQNKGNHRLVVSERAEAFLRTLNRLEKKGWREQFPEYNSTHYRKGRWECIAIWPTWKILFRKRSTY